MNCTNERGQVVACRVGGRKQRVGSEKSVMCVGWIRRKRERRRAGWLCHERGANLWGGVL